VTLVASDPVSWASAITIRDSTIAISGVLGDAPAVITYHPGLTRRYAVAPGDHVPRAIVSKVFMTVAATILQPESPCFGGHGGSP